MTKFGKLTRGEGRISMGHPRPHPKGRDPSDPKVLESHMHAHGKQRPNSAAAWKAKAGMAHFDCG